MLSVGDGDFGAFAGPGTRVIFRVGEWYIRRHACGHDAGLQIY